MLLALAPSTANIPTAIFYPLNLVWNETVMAGTLAAIIIYELTMRIDTHTKNKGKEIKGIFSCDDSTSL